jgi:hypothetical protein
MIVVQYVLAGPTSWEFRVVITNTSLLFGFALSL